VSVQIYRERNPYALLVLQQDVLQFRFQEILQPISTSAPTWDVCVFPEDDDDADSNYAAVFPHSFQRVGGCVGNAFQERERGGGGREIQAALLLLSLPSPPWKVCMFYK
jgi:hypothetical protein